MLWLENAVNKAVEVSGKNNLTRTVKNYADTVVHHAGQAVAGGAKIIQDRMGMRNYKSFKQTIRMFEEAAVSCRGQERVQLLRRWLLTLKEKDRASCRVVDDKSVEQPQNSDESNSPPKSPRLYLFFYSDMGVEPVNFRDVFLRSHALEGITLSMEERKSTMQLQVVFGTFLFLNDEGNLVASSHWSERTSKPRIETSPRKVSLSQMKREQLLQFTQGAISRLKVNADIARVDAEDSKLQQMIDGREALHSSEGSDRTSEKTLFLSVEALKEALSEVRLCSRLEELLLKKRSINPGDSSEVHSQKAHFPPHFLRFGRYISRVITSYWQIGFPPLIV